MSSVLPPAKAILFYDGGCSLCRAEIDHYRRIDRHRRVRWVDISVHPEALRDYGLQPREAMERLHGVRADGDLVVGVAAFVMIWRELPRYRPLAWLASTPGIRGVLDRGYRVFARWRLRRRCRDGLCLP